MFKILGIEGVDFARHLSISPFRYTPSSGEARCFEAEEFRSGQNRHFRIYYICLPDFVLTLAVEYPCFCISHLLFIFLSMLFR